MDIIVETRAVMIKSSGLINVEVKGKIDPLIVLNKAEALALIAQLAAVLAKAEYYSPELA